MPSILAAGFIVLAAREATGHGDLVRLGTPFPISSWTKCQFGSRISHHTRWRAVDIFGDPFYGPTRGRTRALNPDNHPHTRSWVTQDKMIYRGEPGYDPECDTWVADCPDDEWVLKVFEKCHKTSEYDAVCRMRAQIEADAGGGSVTTVGDSLVYTKLVFEPFTGDVDDCPKRLVAFER